MKKTLSKWTIPIISFVNTVLFLGVLTLHEYKPDKLSFFSDISNKINIDQKFRWRGGRSLSDDVLIIGIDDQSLERFGQWPWKRGIIAEGLSKLAASHPKVIALDIVFSEASPFPEEDKKLASTIREINKTIPLMLGYFF